MRIRRLGAVVLATALLTGCVAPPSIGEPVEMPAVLDDYETTGEYPAVWDAPDRLIIVLGGSSSCPTIATSVEEEGDAVRITLHTRGGIACTADQVIAPVALELEGGRPGSVVLVLDGDEHPLDVVDER